MLLVQILIFIIGIAFLWKGGDALVDGCIRVAKSFNVSELIIGLTVLSIGTSAPELFVNILASMQSQSDIVIGNVLGSNISNILLILGVTGLISPFLFPKKSSLIDLPISIGLTIVLGYLIIISPPDVITPTKGFFLIGIIGLYIALTAKYTNKPDLPENIDENIGAKKSIKSDLLLILFGIISLPIGAKCVIYAATEIATGLGISEALISVFAIAFATSLPELATSVIAAKKKKPSLVMGNIIGSNIFNIGLILGISALLNPVQFNSIFYFEIGIVFIISLLVFGFYFLPKQYHLTRAKSVLLLASYVIYLVIVFQRG